MSFPLFYHTKEQENWNGKVKTEFSTGDWNKEHLIFWTQFDKKEDVFAGTLENRNFCIIEAIGIGVGNPENGTTLLY